MFLLWFFQLLSIQKVGVPRGDMHRLTTVPSGAVGGDSDWAGRNLNLTRGPGGRSGSVALCANFNGGSLAGPLTDWGHVPAGGSRRAPRRPTSHCLSMPSRLECPWPAAPSVVQLRPRPAERSASAGRGRDLLEMLRGRPLARALLGSSPYRPLLSSGIS